ncbi:MAG: methionine adenosyltransferase, partial [Firmicutes bacterium]|nr:methionine adenosyltransferase [Bacillota bacterium]
MKRLFTSESVTEGHPDKVCDQISDAIVDAILEQDPMGRVAAESFATTNFAAVMGEITANAEVDFEAIAREVICDIGYDKDEYEFNGNTCEVQVRVHKQSVDIAGGVDNALENRGEDGGKDPLDDLGAGDQGIMFGYACSETEEKMPLAISLAQKLAQKLTEVRKNGTLTYLRPDGKTQVTVEYNEENKPVRIDTVLISTQHDPMDKTAKEDMEEDLIREVILPVVPRDLLDADTNFLINPSGNFVIGGPAGDTG